MFVRFSLREIILGTNMIEVFLRHLRFDIFLTLVRAKSVRNLFEQECFLTIQNVSRPIRTHYTHYQILSPYCSLIKHHTYRYQSILTDDYKPPPPQKNPT